MTDWGRLTAGSTIRMPKQPIGLCARRTHADRSVPQSRRIRGGPTQRSRSDRDESAVAHDQLAIAREATIAAAHREASMDFAYRTVMTRSTASLEPLTEAQGTTPGPISAGSRVAIHFCEARKFPHDGR